MEAVDTAERPIFDRLCSTCTTIFDGTTDWSRARPHLDIRSLSASAKQGCHMCNLMLAELGLDIVQHLKHELEELRIHPKDQIAINFQPLHFDRGLKILASCQGHPPTSALHYFPDEAGRFTIGHLFCASREIGFQLHHRSSSMSNYHTETAEKIKKWLQKCDGNHSECRTMQTVTATRPVLPSRLLDLNDVVHNGQFRLVSTHGFPENTVYATLSHCWGGQCALRLTTSNRLMLQEGFAAEHLPQTFRDSISVTIDLGIRFLWIDALCIIQDSVNDADWLCEAAIMGDVYANSYITIAASSSPNSTAGLFHRRNPLALWPCGVTADWKNRGLDVSDLVVGSFCWGQSHDFQPLSNRAWAYQEWALSKRLMHFCHDQIRWECFCLTACEVYPEGCPKNNKEQKSVKGIIAALSKRSGEEAALGRTNHDLWNEIRANYSRQILPRFSDRLIAFSGITRVVHRLLGHSPQDYLAGHWKPDLLKDLFWTREADESQARSSSPYIEPTWSWASHCPASMSRPLLERESYHAKVLEATTVPVDDVFGALQSATLSLSCKVCVVTLETWMRLAYQNSYECHVTSINGSPTWYKGHLFEDHGTTAPNRQVVSRSFSYVPIKSERGSLARLISGLLVERVSESRNEYIRIGMLGIDQDVYQHQDPEPRDPLVDLFNVRRDGNTEAESQDEEFVGTQVIELI